MMGRWSVPASMIWTNSIIAFVAARCDLLVAVVMKSRRAQNQFVAALVQKWWPLPQSGVQAPKRGAANVLIVLFCGYWMPKSWSDLAKRLRRELATLTQFFDG